MIALRVLRPRLEDILSRLSLVRRPDWDDVLDQDMICLYAGDLPADYPQYSRFFGVTPYRVGRRNILHDLRHPIPMPSNSVDIFQAEDVFEHIELERIPALLDEIFRILKPEGLFRLSVPDYNFHLYRERSLLDERGNLVFDPGGGGRLENGKVVGGGHLWFPTIDIARRLLRESSFDHYEFLQYHEPDGEPVVQPVDHSIARVRRSAELDPRGNGGPVSIIVDATKKSASEPRLFGLRATAESAESTLMRHRMRKFGKDILPPFAIEFGRRLTGRQRKEELFSGDTKLFSEHLMHATAYGEYGCGLSTIWAATNTSVPICSVDTSRYWIEQVRGQIGDRERVELQHVDLGELGDWGRPLTYARRRFVRDYTEGPWRGPHTPDVVLIDGRFRVACFFASLINGPPGTVILFDDYTNRPCYHLVEEFVTRIETCGRQAAFVVPPNLPIEDLHQEYERFLYVLD